MILYFLYSSSVFSAVFGYSIFLRLCFGVNLLKTFLFYGLAFLLKL